jgi:FixJ family two-component response regulator
MYVLAQQTEKALTVYIVDDDESVRTALSRLMRSAGIESRAYESSVRFLEEVRNEDHACILVDMTMPRMSGMELIARLKEKSITNPVIALSARDDDEIRQSARNLGVRFFLRKPVDDQALIDAINWVVKKHPVP